MHGVSNFSSEQYHRNNVINQPERRSWSAIRGRLSVVHDFDCVDDPNQRLGR
jgi:hypothetical protein